MPSLSRINGEDHYLKQAFQRRFLSPGNLRGIDFLFKQKKSSTRRTASSQFKSSIWCNLWRLSLVTKPQEAGSDA